MAHPSPRIGSDDGKAQLAYRLLTIRLPNLRSQPVLYLDAEEVDAVLGMSERIVYSQGLESVFAQDLATGDRSQLSSSRERGALCLGQAKVIRDSSTSALGWKARIATPLDSEKASPIGPQVQPAARSGCEAAAFLRKNQRIHRRQPQKGEESL